MSEVANEISVNNDTSYTCAHFLKRPDEETRVFNKPEPRGNFVKELAEKTHFFNKP